MPRSIVIARSAGDVFAFVSDPRNDPQWHDTVIEVTAVSGGSIRRGSTFAVVYRPQGSSVTYDLVAEMTVYEPGRSSELQVRFVEPRGRVPAMIGRFVLTFQVEPAGPRARLTRGVETRGAALRYRLLELLLEPFSYRSGNARQDVLLGRIKTILENGAAPRAASSRG